MRSLITCAAAICTVGVTFATTYTWTDGAGDHLFSTPGNWDGGAAPTAATASDALAFSVGGLASNDIAGLTVGNVGVTLASGTELTLAGWRFGGNGTLTKTGGGSLVFNATNMPNADYSQAVAVNEGFLKIPISGDFYGPITVAEGACMLCSKGTVNFRGPVEISGAVTNTGAQVHYYTKVKGNPACANAGNTTFFHGGLDGIVTILGGNSYSGQAVFYPETSCFHGYFRTSGEATINGNTGELVRKANNMFVGNKTSNCVIGGITVNAQHNFGGFGDGITDTVLITNSTISVTEAFSAGRPGPGANKATVRLGEGTTVTAAYVLTGYNMWPNFGAIEILPGATVNVTNRICAGYHSGQSAPPKGPTNEWIMVDGGTLNADGIGIGIGYYGSTARFYLKSGTVNAEGVYQKAYRAKGAAYARGGNSVGGTNTYQFVMTGGTFNMGEWGIVSLGCGDFSEAHVILAGGTMNAVKDFPIPYYNPTLFGYGNWRGGAEGGFTLNTAGHTVTLNTALNGMGDVRLTGNGTVAGTNAMQGVLGGKWTVDGGTTADLRGAASLLGGLYAGTNAAVTLDVGAGRSAAFLSRDGSWPLTDEYATNNVLAHFNLCDGGTVSTLISHDMGLWNVSGASTDLPTYSGGSREAMVSKGEFYVAPEEAGTWTFSGIWNNYIHIRIDDASATSTGADKYARLQVALTAGWHRFVIVGVHNSSTCGPASRKGMAVGFAKSAVSGDAAADYTLFSPKNLKMRPSAPCGGEASVRWSTVKTTAWADTTWANVRATTYTNNWDWDAVSLTNSLKATRVYANSGHDRLADSNYIANRWDGWFHVPFDKAGTWRFRLKYRYNIRFYLDGEDLGVEASATAATADKPVSPGWHRYEIRTYRHTGYSGPGDNDYAVSYAVKTAADADFGAFVPFDEDSLTLSLAPDGYLQGEIALASGAAVTNVSETAAVVYGDISANGATGAALVGKFACVSNTVDFGTVAADTADLSTVLKFDDAATNLFADVGRIAVDFASRPTFGRALVGPAGGLDALSESELARRFAVTVDGVPASEVKCIVLPRVSEGKLYLNNVSGTQLLFR